METIYLDIHTEQPVTEILGTEQPDTTPVRLADLPLADAIGKLPVDSSAVSRIGGSHEVVMALPHQWTSPDRLSTSTILVITGARTFRPGTFHSFTTLTDRVLKTSICSRLYEILARLNFRNEEDSRLKKSYSKTSQIDPSDKLQIDLSALEPNCLILKCQGAVVIGTSTLLKEAFDDAIPASTSLIVDFLGVRYVDSTGFVALISGLKQANEKGSKMVLIITNPHILKIASVSGLINVFSIYPSQQAAFASLKTTA